MKLRGSNQEGKAGQVLRFPGRSSRPDPGIRFRRALVSQFHFLQIGELASYHAIDPRTLRSIVKVSLCGLELPDPEDNSLLRHWHSDDQDPPDELICRHCREICHNSLQSPIEHKHGQAG